MTDEAIPGTSPEADKVIKLHEVKATNGKGEAMPRRRNQAFRGFRTSAEFLAAMQPPDYLVDGILLRGCAYTLTGNTGHGKTLLALLLAIRVARNDWFCGRKCRQGTVAFFCGENPENVRMQFYSMCAELKIDGTTLPIIWHDGVFNLEQAIAKASEALNAHGDLALCVFDSLQAFFTGDDDNQNQQMLNTAINFRAMAECHPNRPTNLILAHPVKRATQDNLHPRGGSSISNELDGNLTTWVDDAGIVTFHWLGKLRGIPFDPIKLEVAIIKPDGLVDADGNQMPCTIIRQLGEMRENELFNQASSQACAVLAAMKANPHITERELANQLSTSKSTVHRTISELQRRKWVRQYGNGFKLTQEGKTALEMGKP